MTNPPIIGLIGKKRSGKDTFGSGLVELHDFQRVAFADPLREALLAQDPMVGINGSIERLRKLEPGLAPSQYVRLSRLIQVVGWEVAKDLVPEVRRLLERLGTDSIRRLDDTFWVRIAVERIKSSEKPVVVTDVRFPNEADTIRDLGGIVLRVMRPSLGAQEGEHECETALDDYREDGTIYNNYDLRNLRTLADHWGAVYLKNFRNHAAL